MTNFYFGVLLGKDVKKVTDTNDAEAERKGQENTEKKSTIELYGDHYEKK